jgi:hypothetical protein
VRFYYRALNTAEIAALYEQYDWTWPVAGIDCLFADRQYEKDC